MERTIKFRAKRLDNGEWVEGYYIKRTAHKQTYKGDVVEDGEEHLIFGMSKTDVQPSYYEVDPSTVCQYTGLKDLKGREIYEHDNVTAFPHYGEIIFKDGSFVMHNETMDLPLHYNIGRVEGFENFGRCLVTNQGSEFNRKEGEK